MKPPIHIFVRTLAVAILLSGCTKQELRESANSMPEGQDKQEIQFRFFVEEGDRIIPYEDYWNAVNLPQSGTTSRTARSNMPTEFTLYGVYNTVDVPDGTGAATSPEDAPVDKRFFNGITVNADGTYTGDRRYWVADGKTRHTFAAITGVSTWVDANKLYAGFTTSTFIPVVYERFEDNPKNQKDLLVAYGPANIIVDGVAPIVNIYFKHAMSRLLFKITSSGGAALYDCILNIKYNNVYSRKYIYYTGKTFTTPTNKWNTNYNLNDPITIPSTATSEDNAIELGDMKIHAYNQSDKWLDLTLSYAKAPNGPKTTLKTTLPAVNLQPGMQYNFFVYVSEITETLSISSIVVEPWTTEIRVADPLD